MTSPNATTLTAIEALRRQAAHVIELIDAILYAQHGVAKQATTRLLPGLLQLVWRVQSTLDAIGGEESTP